MSRENKLIKSSLILLLGTFLPRIINLITTPLLTKYTTGGEFGFINFLTTTILGLVIPICTLQLEQACYRYLISAKTHKEKCKVITSIMLLIFAIMIVVAGVCLIIPFNVDIDYFNYLIIAYIWVGILVQMLRFILRAFSMYKHFSYLSIIAVVTNFIILYVCLVILKMGYISSLISLTLSEIIVFFYIIFSIKFWRFIKPTYFDFNLLKEMLYYVFPFIPNVVAGYVNNLSDQWIIVSMLDLTANGIYTMANKIPSILNLIYPAINVAWTESAINSLEDKDYKKYYNKMFKSIFCLLTSVTLCLMAISPIFFSFLNQSESLNDAILYVPILIVAVYFLCFSQFFSSIFIAFKLSKNVLHSTLSAAIVNVILNLMFIKVLGIYAAVLSTLISNFILAAIRYIEINKKHCRLHLPRKTIIAVSILFIVTGFLSLSNNNILIGVNIGLSLIVSYILIGDMSKVLFRSVLKKLRR